MTSAVACLASSSFVVRSSTVLLRVCVVDMFVSVCVCQCVCHALTLSFFLSFSLSLFLWLPLAPVCSLWPADYDLPLAESHFKSYPIQLRVTLLAPHSDREVSMRSRLARYVVGWRIG